MTDPCSRLWALNMPKVETIEEVRTQGRKLHRAIQYAFVELAFADLVNTWCEITDEKLIEQFRIDTETRGLATKTEKTPMMIARVVW